MPRKNTIAWYKERVNALHADLANERRRRQSAERRVSDAIDAIRACDEIPDYIKDLPFVKSIVAINKELGSRWETIRETRELLFDSRRSHESTLIKLRNAKTNAFDVIVKAMGVVND